MRGAVATAGVVAAGRGAAAQAGPVNLALPSLRAGRRPARTPVEHLVVVMMENRSVDHYLGWYGVENPDFDATQVRSFPDLRQGPHGPMVTTEPWGQRGRKNFHGRGFADPSHGWGGGRAERNGGACDGWLAPATHNDALALSTYDAVDIPVWARLVRDYQAYDRWFCSLLGPTQPNRYYLHSAQSGGLKNNDLPPQLAEAHPEWTAGWDWPTIWTLCEAYGVTAKYYFSNLPQIAFWGARHLAHARPIAEYYLDAAAGTLPQVAMIDPWFIAPDGIANDDHPHADIRLGQAFLSDVVQAFGSSPCYRKGALVVTYDEWGGFWDHVDPPRLPDDRATPLDPGGEQDFGQVGFRIPTSVMSPWTRTPDGTQSRVDHTVYEHSSFLRFVSENWGLPHLTARDRSTNSLGKVFRGFTDFDPDPSFVPYEAPLLLAVDPALESTLAALDPLGLDTGASSSDLHRLAETGWFDNLPVNIDLRFEDSFLHSRPELLVDALAPLGL